MRILDFRSERFSVVVMKVGDFPQLWLRAIKGSPGGALLPTSSSVMNSESTPTFRRRVGALKVEFLAVLQSVCDVMHVDNQDLS